MEVALWINCVGALHVWLASQTHQFGLTNSEVLLDVALAILCIATADTGNPDVQAKEDET